MEIVDFADPSTPRHPDWNCGIEWGGVDVIRHASADELAVLYRLVKVELWREIRVSGTDKVLRFDGVDVSGDDFVASFSPDLPAIDIFQRLRIQSIAGLKLRIRLTRNGFIWCAFEQTGIGWYVPRQGNNGDYRPVVSIGVERLPGLLESLSHRYAAMLLAGPDFDPHIQELIRRANLSAVHLADKEGIANLERHGLLFPSAESCSQIA